jgi:hypothetical protein
MATETPHASERVFRACTRGQVTLEVGPKVAFGDPDGHGSDNAALSAPGARRASSLALSVDGSSERVHRPAGLIPPRTPLPSCLSSTPWTRKR